MVRFAQSVSRAFCAAAVVAGALVATVATSGLASATTVPGRQIPFSFEFTGLGARQPVAIVYGSGTQYSQGYLKRGSSRIQVEGGGIYFIQFASNGFSLAANRDGTNETVTDRLFVNEPPLQGSVVLPNGGTVTITNEDTHYSAHLAGTGSFIIPTGIS
jgi:hypothetical protein